MEEPPIPYILIKKDGVVKPFKEISEQELQEFNRLNDYLREFDNSQGILPLVQSNSLELDNYVSHLQSINHKIPVPRRKHVEINDEINRLLLNFLASARIYLDHTETRLKRRYGKQSKQVKRFKLATSSAYDGLFIYRFFYKLRNYVQHCGTAIKVTSIFSSSLPGKVDIHRIKVEFDPQELLENYKEWGPVKVDLEKETKSINLKGFAPEVVNNLKIIDSYVYLGEFPELYKAGSWIVDLLEDVFLEGQNPQVGTLQKKGKILKGKFSEPAFDVLQVVGVANFIGTEPVNMKNEYFPMFGFCFKIAWNEIDRIFTISCPSIPEILVQDTDREKAIDKADLKFKSVMKEYLESVKRPPVPLTWREQFNLINKDIVT